MAGKDPDNGDLENGEPSAEPGGRTIAERFGLLLEPSLGGGRPEAPEPGNDLGANGLEAQVWLRAGDQDDALRDGAIDKALSGESVARIVHAV